MPLDAYLNDFTTLLKKTDPAEVQVLVEHEAQAPAFVTGLERPPREHRGKRLQGRIEPGLGAV